MFIPRTRTLLLITESVWPSSSVALAKLQPQKDIEIPDAHLFLHKYSTCEIVRAGTESRNSSNYLLDMYTVECALEYGVDNVASDYTD